VACYRLFIAGLLDLTDNVDKATGDVVTPPEVVRRDGDDAYLVVAADKGTATFSDIANEVAASYGFWLGDAFASGGSVGYDHKAMGITAKGAWEAVRRHFREMGVDTQTEDFTVVGVGDMSGDVFGNGMLLSKHIRLLAAFDHRHIFIDPDPDAATSFAERERVFALPRSSWDDYDRGSARAGVYAHGEDGAGRPDARGARYRRGHHRAEPARTDRGHPARPGDLLWNGGIGTYVKVHQSHADAGDKTNDACAPTAGAARQGGGQPRSPSSAAPSSPTHRRKDQHQAIDNSAGVDCSDHEVNIKILPDRLSWR
jgi:glutamate dehydrogenase